MILAKQTLACYQSLRLTSTHKALHRTYTSLVAKAAITTPFWCFLMWTFQIMIVGRMIVKRSVTTLKTLIKILRANYFQSSLVLFLVLEVRVTNLIQAFVLEGLPWVWQPALES